MWVAFALTFFQQNISAYLRITRCKFYESLTNDVISFEQLGPAILHTRTGSRMDLFKY